MRVNVSYPVLGTVFTVSSVRGGLGWLNTDKQSKLSNLVIKLTIQRSYIAPSHELCVIDIFKSAFRKGQF